MTKETVYNEMVVYLTENREKFYRLAFSYVKNRDSALDIVQNAVCKALEHYSDIRDLGKINSWFYRVLINEAYTYIKKHSKEYSVPDGEIPEGVYHEKAFERDDALYSVIDELPKNLKTIVILRFFEELPLSDIANITGTNLSTVKTRLYSALKKLKKSYEEAGKDE